MNVGTGAILIGVLVVVMVFLYLGQREKNAVRRKQRRKFSPQWSRKDRDASVSDRRAGGDSRRRRT